MRFALLAFAATALVVGVVFWLGGGRWSRGRVRLYRRIRAVRRRALAPRLDSLREAVASGLLAPARRSIAGEIQRLSEAVERSGVAAERIAATRKGLDGAVARLSELAPARLPDAPGRPRAGARELDTGRGWLMALLIALAAASVAAANTWLLHEQILPLVPGDSALRVPGVDSLTAAAVFSGLPLLLGFAYFLVSRPGPTLAARLTLVVVALALIAQMVLEGATIVVAIEARGLATPTWWGGAAIALLLGGAGALVPALILSGAHGAADRLDRWRASRGRRTASLLLARQDQAAARVDDRLRGLQSRMDELRRQLDGIVADPAGALLLTPGGAPSVERAAHVLRRLGLTVETGTAATTPGTRPAAVVPRLLRDAALVAVWVAALAAATLTAQPALLAPAASGALPLQTIAIVGALTALALGGLLLRAALAARPLRRDTPARAVLILMFAGALAALSYALGARLGDLSAAAPALETAALLYVYLLLAALASLRLREGVHAAAALASLLFTGVAWTLLAGLDLALRAAERLARGQRRDVRVPSASRTHPA